MNVLEKILEEIKERIEKLNMADNMCRENAERNRNFEGMKYFQSLMFATERAKNIIEYIIRSHMEERNYGTIQKYIAMDTPQIMTKSLCDFFKSEVKEIHEKLLAAGIKTNPVFYTETDKKNFMKGRNK